MPDSRYFLQVAQAVATASKDPSRKVGAVIVGPKEEIRSTGYNGFVRKTVDSPDRWERPEKYRWVIHAEANAIIQAARMGVPIDGCTLYCTCQPCLRCAQMIAQVGIVNVVSLADVASGFVDDQSDTRQLFKEAGVGWVHFTRVEEEEKEEEGSKNA